MAHAYQALARRIRLADFEFRRGFAWKVGFAQPRPSSRTAVIFAAAPIQAFDIDPGGRSEMDALADWPHLRASSALSFTSPYFSADDADRLGHSPHAVNLTELAFDFAGITVEGLEALTRTPLFPRLTRSTSAPVRCRRLLADALGAIRERGALTSLSLASNRITSIDAEHLSRSPCFAA